MKNKKQVINYIVILFLLLLSAININSYFTPKQVLGISNNKTEISDIEFWNNFIKDNPKYLPAYIELEDIKKVKQLDPNFNTSN